MSNTEVETEQARGSTDEGASARPNHNTPLQNQAQVKASKDKNDFYRERAAKALGALANKMRGMDIGIDASPASAIGARCFSLSSPPPPSPGPPNSGPEQQKQAPGKAQQEETYRILLVLDHGRFDISARHQYQGTAFLTPGSLAGELLERSIYRARDELLSASGPTQQKQNPSILDASQILAFDWSPLSPRALKSLKPAQLRAYQNYQTQRLKTAILAYAPDLVAFSCVDARAYAPFVGASCFVAAGASPSSFDLRPDHLLPRQEQQQPAAMAKATAAPTLREGETGSLFGIESDIAPLIRDVEDAEAFKKAKAKSRKRETPEVLKMFKLLRGAPVSCAERAFASFSPFTPVSVPALADTDIGREIGKKPLKLPMITSIVPLGALLPPSLYLDSCHGRPPEQDALCIMQNGALVNDLAKIMSLRRRGRRSQAPTSAPPLSLSPAPPRLVLPEPTRAGLEACPWITYIDTLSAWETFYARLKQSRYVCFDTETDNLNPVEDNHLLMLQFGIGGHAYIVPFEHPQSPFLGNTGALERIKKDLRDWIEDPASEKTTLVGHNLKFDLHILRQCANVRYIAPLLADTMVGAYFLDEYTSKLSTLDPDYKGSLSLAAAAMGWGAFDYLAAPVSKQDRANLAQSDLMAVAVYGALDAIIPLHVLMHQSRRARAQGYADFQTALTRLGGALLKTYVEMEQNGTRVDIAYLEGLTTKDSDLSKHLQEALDALAKKPSAKRAALIAARQEAREREKAQSGARREQSAPLPGSLGLFGGGSGSGSGGAQLTEEGPVFAPTKPAHRRALFFDVLKLAPLSYTAKTRQPQTDKAFLKEYAGKVEEVALYQNYQDIHKIASMFVWRQPDLVKRCTDRRLRAEFSFVGVDTMRGSAKKPNLQQIPTRGPLAKIVKRQFQAPPGSLILSYDLNANELRGFANIAKDPAMAQAFTPGILGRRRLRLAEMTQPELWGAYQAWKEKTGFDKAAIQDKRVILAELAGLTEDADEGEGKAVTETIKAPATRAFIVKMAREEIALKLEGDVHLQNLQRFRGISPDKATKQDRDQIKTIGFATVYGQSLGSLAKALYPEKLARVRDICVEKKASVASFSNWPSAAKALFNEMTNNADALVDAMWKAWPQAKKWMDGVLEEWPKEISVPNVLGWHRRLWGYWSPVEYVQKAMNRKGPNSLLQGPSANMNNFAAMLCLEQVFLFERALAAQQKEQKEHPQSQKQKQRLIFTKAVHDANYYECPIPLLPVAMYWLEHAATTLTEAYCEKFFGWRMLVGPEVAFEAGPDEAALRELGYGRASLETLVKDALENPDSASFSLEAATKEKLLAAALHNYDLIAPYRALELEALGDAVSALGKVKGGERNNRVGMLLTADKMASLGLILDGV